MEMDSLNESDLHHFSQDEYFGYDDQMGQTSGEKGNTYVVDKLTEYFGDLEPHGKGEKTKTKGELKAFTETVLAFPVSIRLDSLPNNGKPEMTSADEESKSQRELHRQKGAIQAHRNNQPGAETTMTFSRGTNA